MKKMVALMSLSIGLLFFTGCKSFGPTPQETSASVYKYLGYANHPQTDRLIVIKGSEKKPATFTMSGSEIEIRTVLPTINPPTDSNQKAEIVKSISDTAKTLGLAGTAAYLLNGADGGTTTTTTNNYTTAP